MNITILNAKHKFLISTVTKLVVTWLGLRFVKFYYPKGDRKGMPLPIGEIRRRARVFAKDFEGIHQEQKESQTYWNRFFEVFGKDRMKLAEYEKRITKDDGDDGRIDVFWPGELIIEHKSKGKDLSKAHKQVMGYFSGIDEVDLPKRMIVSDFEIIRLYHFNDWGDYTEINLRDLTDNIELFDFISGHKPRDFSKNVGPVTIKAAKKLSKLVDAISKSGHYEDLDHFLTKVIFCMFAEDSNIIEKGLVRQLIDSKSKKDGSDLGDFFSKLFRVLNQDPEKRSVNLDPDFSELPFIGGRLFENKGEQIDFSEDMRISILELFNLDWREVSPSLFGSLFQQVMNPKERANLGSHYTSDENILKLINSLFMDELKQEFERCKLNNQRLNHFHAKLGSIKVLDPASGVGNFLALAYQELRLLEFEVLKKLRLNNKQSEYQVQSSLSKMNEWLKVDISSFYGIEIDRKATEISYLVMYIIEHQINQLMSKYFVDEPIFIRETTLTGAIVNANALEIDWNNVVEKGRLTYIIGNPPFLGYTRQSRSQKNDIKRIMGCSNVDYVTAWFKLAKDYVNSTDIRVGFVATNSITQGEHVSLLWKQILQGTELTINFAHQTFAWKNKAPKKAAVHVVIIGFWKFDGGKKYLFEYSNINNDPQRRAVDHINPYLMTFESAFIEKRMKPLCDVPRMSKGSAPTDDGNLLLTEEERKELIKENPIMEKYVKRYLGSDEFLNTSKKYCLWLKEQKSSDLLGSNFIKTRVDRVRVWRASREKARTKEYAKYPYLFAEERQPKSDYLLIPRVSSTRKYVPMGYFPKDVIVNENAFALPEADEYTYGVICSLMHMTWMKYTCGRLKSDYRYSNTIVYNNFPWPQNPTKANVSKVVEAVKELRKLREELEKESSPAALYSIAMPKKLNKLHEKIDKLVEKCYRQNKFNNEESRIEYLMDQYIKLTKDSP